MTDLWLAVLQENGPFHKDKHIWPDYVKKHWQTCALLAEHIKDLHVVGSWRRGGTDALANLIIVPVAFQ